MNTADEPEAERRRPAGLKRALELMLAPRTGQEQADREDRVADAEHDIRPRRDVEQLGREAPTPSAPTVAASAVRHQASHVRSAAIDVR